MRMWPRSIAGRATLVLIGGVLAVLWAGAMVWWLSVARGDGPPGMRISFESIAGIAAISIPGGFLEGLPIGMQLIGPSFSEETLLHVAHAYEQATGWHKLRPPAP